MSNCQLQEIRYCEIPLSRGYIAKVSREDADLASASWFARSGRPYPVRNNRGDRWPRILYMHRVVAARMFGEDALNRFEVDHINGDPTDNRRENLRLATTSQNRANIGKPGHNTSGVKGVSFYKRTGRFRAFLQSGGKHFHLGYFDTLSEAQEAYNRAAGQYFGEFANIGEPIRD